MPCLLDNLVPSAYHQKSNYIIFHPIIGVWVGLKPLMLQCYLYYSNKVSNTDSLWMLLDFITQRASNFSKVTLWSCHPAILPSCPSHAIPAPGVSDNFYCMPSHLSQAAPRQPQCQTKKALDARSWMNDNVIRVLCMWGMNHETWCHETPKPRQALDTRSWMENQFVWMHHARNRYWNTGPLKKSYT